MIRLIYDGESEFDFMRQCHENYRNYLASIKDSAPRSAYEFAAAEWHYHPGDRRSPHDASIISVEMCYVDPTAKPAENHLEIKVKLQGAWHKDKMLLTYKNVEYYNLQKSALTGVLAKNFKRPHAEHGEWLVDEMHISPEGLVIHEIEWASSASWTVQCEDIEFIWIPNGGEDDSPKTQYEY
jgi:hypothetical protein